MLKVCLYSLSQGENTDTQKQHFYFYFQKRILCRSFELSKVLQRHEETYNFVFSSINEFIHRSNV